MRTIKFNNTDLEINYTNALTAGHGHKKITVELCYLEEYKTFYATTHNMPSYDEATELEGKEKDEALFRIIEWQIGDEVTEWLDEIRAKNNS